MSLGERSPHDHAVATSSADVNPTSPDVAGATHASEPPARRGWVRRNAWWLAVLSVVAAILTWRATSGGSAQRGFAPPAASTPVRAAAATIGNLDLMSTYPGEIVGEVADIAPEVSGVLRQINVRIGDRVQQGQTLAVIDDVNLRNQAQEAGGQLGVAEANERRAQAELLSATAEHVRASELMEQRLLSEQEFDRIEATLATQQANVAASKAQSQQARARLRLLEQQLSDSRVVAPFAGTVSDRYVDRGTLVQPGTPLIRLVQDTELHVQFRVPERDLGNVRVGVPFASTTVATRDQTFGGVVERVAGEVSRTDRTAIVEGRLHEVSDVLKPGMYAEVRVQLEEVIDSILVSSQAVVERVAADGKESVGVFVLYDAPDATDEETRTAVWVDVDVLGSSEGRTAVRGNLRENDMVLTMGHADLRDGAIVRVVQVEQVDGRPGAAGGVS